MHASVIMEEKRIEERLNLAVMITFERDEEGVTGGVTKYSCMFFFWFQNCNEATSIRFANSVLYWLQREQWGTREERDRRGWRSFSVLSCWQTQPALELDAKPLQLHFLCAPVQAN